MGFGGHDGCVKGGPMYGECPFHPGESMLRCSTCLLLKLRSEKVTKTCNLIGCDNPVENAAVYCCEAHMLEATTKVTLVRETGYEFVDHPKHYNEHPAGIECIDVIEHMPHNVGAAMKYLWRAGLKPGEDSQRDLDKAIWYTNREKERLAKIKK